MVRRVLKADTQLVVNQPLELEDEFRTFYGKALGKNAVPIEPPFNPLQLIALCYRNSALQQCIHAMEVNVDGTGYGIELIEGKTKNDKEREILDSFFKEPFPGQSFLAQRRKLRVDMEQVGYAYLEVIRNAQDKSYLLRPLEVALTRIVRYDAPITREVELEREGVKRKVKISVRERRFVQMVGQTTIFYKEFGASRDLNRNTGEWAKPGEKLALELKASEILFFTVDKDTLTPYGIPRWINNTPSVLGGRKAEEFNLEFFDAGGLPPAIIFVEGGAIAGPVLDQLTHFLSGGAKDKNRAAVVSVQSATGSLEQAGKVAVKTERFGDSRQSDALFQEYGANSEERVRAAFRLPPIFLGKAQDYSFASAMTSYMVAEAQVFQPERSEFDESINRTVMRSLGAENYEFKSKPITLKDTTIQLQALEQAKTMIKPEDYITQLSDVSGLALTYDEATVIENQTRALEIAHGRQDNADDDGDGDGTPFPGTSRGNRTLQQKSSQEALVELAGLWCVAMGMEKGPAMSDMLKADVILKVRSLNKSQRALFDAVLSSRSFVQGAYDQKGLAEIAGACCDLMEGRILKHESGMAEALKTVVEKVGGPQKIDLNLKLEMPEQKKTATRKVAVLPGGQEIVIKTEDMH